MKVDCENDDIKISVIIPHKNSLQLLRRCIESVPVRDDLEVIVVDDNSDIEQKEWDDFRKRYNHVRLFVTKEGKGAGYARNIGLQKAAGKWLVFADADDFFYPHAFDKICCAISNSNMDIFYFHSDARDGITNELLTDRLPNIKKGILENDFDLLRYKSYVPWGKVIKRELVNIYNIKFEEIEASNDIMFSTLVGYYSKNIGLIRDTLYCSTRNSSSLVYNPTLSRLTARVGAAERVNVFLIKNDLITYRYKVSKYVFAFLPQHPILFFRMLKLSSYRGHSFLYFYDTVVYVCSASWKKAVVKFRK